jgi:hypothetical protein
MSIKTTAFWRSGTPPEGGDICQQHHIGYYWMIKLEKHLKKVK